NRSSARVDRQLDRASLRFNHQLDLVGQRYVKADPSFKTAVDTLKANVRAAETAVKGMFDSELQTAGTNLRNQINSVNGAMTSVRTAAATAAGSSALSTAYQGLTTG